MTIPTPQDIPPVDNFSIVGRESHNLTKTIKEGTFIRVNNPFLNRKIGSINGCTYGMRSSTPPTSKLRNSTSYLCFTVPLIHKGGHSPYKSWLNLTWCKFSHTGKGALKYSLNLSPNMPVDLPIYSLSHFTWNLSVDVGRRHPNMGMGTGDKGDA